MPACVAAAAPNSKSQTARRIYNARCRTKHFTKQHKVALISSNAGARLAGTRRIIHGWLSACSRSWQLVLVMRMLFLHLHMRDLRLFSS